MEKAEESDRRAFRMFPPVSTGVLLLDAAQQVLLPVAFKRFREQCTQSQVRLVTHFFFAARPCIALWSAVNLPPLCCAIFVPSK